MKQLNIANKNYPFLLLFFLLGVLFLCSDSVKAQQNSAISYLKKTPPPVWVSDIDIPQATKARRDQVKRGVHYRLSSFQVRYHNAARVEYARLVAEVTNREGLEHAANIQINFRPNFDQIFVHRIIIHRNGKKIDLLDKTRFQVFQRESNLERGIVDGQLTAFANLPDVRVGDIVEYTFSLTYKTILMSGDFFDRFSTSYNVPIGILERRVIVPENFKLQFKYSRQQHKPAIDTNKGETSYTWLITDPDPYESEATGPKWYDLHDTIDISTIKSWRDVAKNSLPHYPVVEQLPAAFSVKVDAIGKRSADPKRRLADILALVQNEIRYVGIEIGRGAFIPRPPELVISRGYGDCKDKAYVMVTALHKLGIKAVPVLAHLEKGISLHKQLPSPYAFNHVIVRASIGNKTYWLDPTGTQQYSPDPAASQPNYGYVLPISTNSSDLVEIKPRQLLHPETRVEETIEFAKAVDKPVLTLKVMSFYRGKSADDFRRKIAVSGKQKLANLYLDYYKNIYAGIERKKPLNIADDKLSNVIHMVESYQVPARAEREAFLKKITLRADNVRSVLPLINKDDRTSPIALSYPIYKEHKIILKNISPGFSPPKPITISKPYVDFMVQSTVSGNVLKIVWQIKTRRDHILPGETKAYRKIRDRVLDNSDWQYNALKQTDGDYKEILYLIVSIAIMGFVIFSAWWGLKADNEYAENAKFFPVAIWKIILMTVTSGGLYIYFWYWKHWRWALRHSERPLKPWARMSFYPFWAYPAFISANRDKQNKRPLPGWLGPVVLVAGLSDAAFGIVEMRYGEAWPINWQIMLFCAGIVAGLITILPTAQAVLRLNEQSAHGEVVLVRNSRLNTLNIIGIMLFPIIFWGLYFT